MINRDIFQLIWQIVRPLTQKKLKQVCKKFKEWGDKFGLTLPNLQELENPINWDMWIEESKINVFNSKIRVWSWLTGNVSVCVYFEYLDPNWLLKMIKARYYDKENSDHHSFIQIGLPVSRMEIGMMRLLVWKTKSGGRKSSHLVRIVEKKESAKIYKKFAEYLANIRSNQKIQNKMFPYCRCICNPRPKDGNYPNKSYLIMANSFQCNKCIEVSQPIDNQVHTRPTN
jgi:hypothetical protein